MSEERPGDKREHCAFRELKAGLCGQWCILSWQWEGIAANKESGQLTRGWIKVDLVKPVVYGFLS